MKNDKKKKTQNVKSIECFTNILAIFIKMASKDNPPKRNFKNTKTKKFLLQNVWNKKREEEWGSGRLKMEEAKILQVQIKVSTKSNEWE